MDVERWDVLLERVILGLVLSALGLAVLAFGGVRLREFLIVEGLVAASAIVWMIRIWAIRSHRLLWPPVCWAVLAFSAWAAWRALNADVRYVAWAELARILTYATLFLVVLNNLHCQETAHGLAWSLVGLATLLCFYGAWQFATAGNSVWGLSRGEGYEHRASGSYVCPNHFAGLLEMLIPLCLATLIAGRVRPTGRILLGYCALAMLAGVALTVSRGGLVAATVGVVFVLAALARHRDYRWPAVACLAVVLVAGTAVAGRMSAVKQRFQIAGELNPQARNTRPMIWRAAFGMWRDHPWLGVGPAHFAERFKQYRTHWAYAEPERAHNDYLDALADWGVAGTAVVASAWGLLGYGIVRTLRRVRRDPGDLEIKRSGRYAFVLGATGGLIALLVHSVTDFNFHIPANAMVAVTLMALLAGYSRYATDDWWISSRVPWRLLVTPLVLALAGVLAWDLSRRGPETAHLLRARRAPFASDAYFRELDMAWTLESKNANTAYLLGEGRKHQSFLGDPGYESLALQALEWFHRAAALNPFDPRHRFSAGMCLDWLGRHDEASAEFQSALKLDPEGRITSFHLGWHEMQLGNTAAARQWFLKSIEQGWPPYDKAEAYLRLLDQHDPHPARQP